MFLFFEKLVDCLIEELTHSCGGYSEVNLVFLVHVFPTEGLRALVLETLKPEPFIVLKEVELVETRKRGQFPYQLSDLL